VVLRCDREGAEPAAGEAEARVEEVAVRVAASAVLDTQAVLAGKGGVGGDVQSVIGALDVVLGEGNSLRFVEVGRTFYSDRGARDLGGGAQAWRGFYQSIRMTEGGLAVNVDESFTPFWMQASLVELCKAAGRGGLPRDEYAWRRLGKDLHSLRVRARHTGICYRVFGFSPRGAGETMFKGGDNGEMLSVAQYMVNAYGLRLQQPDLPCVRTNPRRDIFIPIELLDVCPKQRRAKAMTPVQTSNMIRLAALKPGDRKRNAQSSIATASYNTDETCKSFGMSVNPALVKVSARVLPPPPLEYHGGLVTQASNGAWNMARNRLFQGATVYHWMVVQVGRFMREPDVAAFVQQMGKIGADNGINFVQRKPTVHNGVGERQFEGDLVQLIAAENRRIKAVKGQEHHHLQLIIVLKEKQDTAVYNAVKRICDIQLGIASQVLLSKKIVTQRRPEQYISNVLLKINAKLGGQNVKVQQYLQPAVNPAFLKAPHIVLGADVTHPAPGSGGRPSVAALVGSKDVFGIQYTGALRNQGSRKEIIEDMGSMFLEVYKRWFNNFNPRKHAEAIIMFRDGVSEGQYQEVLDKELPAIRRACTETCKFRPKITYIIVTKRHHARFFGGSSTKPSDLDRNGNVVAGTVIDTGITSPNVWDFYLNSHAGIQGTNRPSKYTVLLDENSMTADQLQAYIFRLSHGYARCTRSVSMVNSAYYAHLLAFRGRVFLGDEGSDDASSTMSGGSSANAVIPATERPHPNVESRLFFV
jgi:eukaryotic translation initiation factor 2C